MNNFYIDVGYKSIYHDGEELCGDHVEVINKDEGNIIVVLADGLGSGVKASILSTLTSKMISTLLSNDLSIDDCIESVTKTLPIDKEKNIAYCTFTIIKINREGILTLVQYDNPESVMIRNGKITDIVTKSKNVGDKKLLVSNIKIKENDVFAIFSDGCPYASPVEEYNYDFGTKEIKDFIQVLDVANISAKNMADQFIGYVNKLYGFKPKDDATCAIVKVKKVNTINVLFGLALNPDDTERMLNLFFSKPGKKVICGGTTSSVAANHIGGKLVFNNPISGSNIPPTANLEGVELVTEGIITINKVTEYAKDFVNENLLYNEWGYNKDGASILSRLLFEEATNIEFYVGKTVNPAHQNPDLPINFSIKIQIVKDLIGCLRKMGKVARVNYF